MPIVRVDEKGKKVPDQIEVYLKEFIEKSEKKEEERVAAKREGLKSVALFLTVCNAASLGLFYLFSPDVGIFTAVLASSVASVLNLYTD